MSVIDVEYTNETRGTGTGHLILQVLCIAAALPCCEGTFYVDDDEDSAVHVDDAVGDAVGDTVDVGRESDIGAEDGDTGDGAETAPYDPCNGLDDDGDGACDGGFACCAGESQSQACGRCGTQSRTCSANCSWDEWSRCTDEGSCSPGETQSRTCGNCGTQARSCSEACSWSAWGACTNEGPCSPGATADCSTYCGSSRRTCDATCRWGPCGPPYDMMQFYPFPDDRTFHHDTGEKIWWEHWAANPEEPNLRKYTIHHWWGTWCPRIDDVFVWDMSSDVLTYTDTFGYSECRHTYEQFRWAPRCMDINRVYGGAYGGPRIVGMGSPCVGNPANCGLGPDEGLPWTDDVEYLTGLFSDTMDSPYTGTVPTLRHDVTSCHVNQCDSGPPEGSFCLTRGEEHWWFWWDSSQQRFVRIRHQGLHFNPGGGEDLDPDPASGPTCNANECSEVEDIQWQIDHCWKVKWDIRLTDIRTR